MIKNFFRRILSVASALAIVFTACPPVVFAEAEFGLCPHHPEHTAECGFVEGVSPCGFVCEICNPPQTTQPTEPSDPPEVTTVPEVTTAPEENETAPFEPLPDHVEHDGISLPWSDPSSLPSSAGSYYLTTDVTLEDDWIVPAGGVNLCLNGQTVSCYINGVQIKDEASLTVYDCSEGEVGSITSLGLRDGDAGRLVYIDNGHFTLKGGKIVHNEDVEKVLAIGERGENATITIEGGIVESGIEVWTTGGSITVTGGEIRGGIQNGCEPGKGTLTISGGTITGGMKTLFGYYAVVSGTSFNLSGKPIIKGVDGDIAIQLGTINIENPLSGGPYSVKFMTLVAGGDEGFTMTEAGVFATGAGAAESVNCFTSADPKYAVRATSDGHLELVEVHTHADGTNFETKWDSETELPTEEGSYFLTTDVNLSEIWSPKGEVSICLNGHKIDCGGSNYLFVNGGSLTVYDCDPDKKGEITGSGDFSPIQCNGTIIINGGKISRGNGTPINVSSGNLTINDGEITGLNFDSGIQIYDGNLLVNGGTIQGRSHAIDIHGGAVEINDGTIKSTGSEAVSNASWNGDGELTIHGGEFIAGDSAQYAVQLLSDYCKLTLSGSPKFSNENVKTDIRVNSSKPNIEFDGELTTTEPIKIDVALKKQAFTVGAGENGVEAGQFEYVGSDGYEIKKVGDELWLVPEGAHVHEDDGTIFLPWDSTDSLPTDPGNYYLKNNVDISARGDNWNVQGDTKLCLNGHKITFDSMKWAEVPAGVSLTVYDCSNLGSIVGERYCVRNINGTFTLESGTIEADGGEAINAGSGKIVINGGTVNGDVSSDYSGSSITITDGQINGQVTASGDLNISGGTITSSSMAVSAKSSFTLSGKPTIKGGEGVDISLSSPYSPPITINEKLGGGPYSIEAIAARYNISESCIIAKGTGAAASIGCFKLAQSLIDQGYEIAAVDDTLVARLRTYTIKYESGGGTGTVEQQTKTHGENITISSEKFTRSGYTQIGWSTEQGASVVKYAFGADYTENANLTLYPVWEEQDTVHIFYSSYNGTAGEQRIISPPQRKICINSPVGTVTSMICSKIYGSISSTIVEDSFSIITIVIAFLYGFM